MRNRDDGTDFVERELGKVKKLATAITRQYFEEDELKGIAFHAYLMAKKKKVRLKTTEIPSIFWIYLKKILQSYKTDTRESVIQNRFHGDSEEADSLLENISSGEISALYQDNTDICPVDEIEAMEDSSDADNCEYDKFLINRQSFVRAGCASSERVIHLFGFLNGKYKFKNILKLYKVSSKTKALWKIEKDLTDLCSRGLGIYKGVCLNGYLQCVLVCAEDERDARRILGVYGQVVRFEPYVLSADFYKTVLMPLSKNKKIESPEPVSLDLEESHGKVIVTKFDIKPETCVVGYDFKNSQGEAVAVMQ